MKINIKYLLLILFLIIPAKAFALNGSATLSCSPASAGPGSTINCTLNGNGSEGSVTAVSGSISLSSGLSLNSCTRSTGWEGNCDGGNIGLYTDINKTNSFGISTFSVKINDGATPGTQNISVNNIKFTDESFNEVSIGNKSVGVSVLSTENTLSSLSVSGGTLSPSFSANTTSYSATVNAASTTITAAAVDGATISGTGTKTLNYGNNTFTVVVTAAAGNTKTYTISINRPDNRSTNNSLKSLTVTSTNISLNSNTSYTATVENNVTSIKIEGSVEDSTASVTGLGAKNLNVGSNIYKIVVTAENGSQKTYTVTIVRKNADGVAPVLSNNKYLKSISIEGITLEFKKDVYSYSVSVENNIEKLNVLYEVEDAKANASITGNDKFIVGNNKIEIVVTAEDGTTSTYTINVERKTVVKKVENDTKKIIDALTEDDSLPIEIEVDDSKSNIVSKEILKELKETKKSIIYVVNNKSGGILYSTTVDGAKITDITKEFKLNMKFSSSNKKIIDKIVKKSNLLYLNFNSDGSLPGKVLMKIFVGDKYKDKTNVYIYYYNENTKKLELINDSIVVKNGYVEFEIDHHSDYVLLDKLVNNSIPVWIIITICVLLTAIIGLIVKIILTHKNKKQENDEIIDIQNT